MRTLEQRIEALDSKLIAAGVPLQFRPLDCFKRLHGSVPPGARREALFAPITQWYLEKYGEAIYWDGIVGRFPILIRGVVYLGVARAAINGNVVSTFQEGIENLPDQIATSLDADEGRHVLERLAIGTRGLFILHHLIMDDVWLGELQQGLVRRAFYDLANAAATLKHTGDTQTAVVQAHEAAEKFLKAALIRTDSQADIKEFGHNIPKLFRELLKAQPRYECVSLAVKNLQKRVPNMQLRYGEVPTSLAEAVECYYGALYVCQAIGQMWVFDQERGSTKSDFKECSFYIDGADATFYCSQVLADKALMIAFRSSPYTGSQMAEIEMDLLSSAHYLEITDPVRDQQLRRQIIFQYRNRGPKATAEGARLKQVHGSEGSYATVLLSTPAEELKK
jgi:HEPN domain-containing protein